MTELLLLFLVLLQIKHWLIDFVFQSNIEIASKGIYGDFHGVMHSIKHGVGTVIVVIIIAGGNFVFFAAILGLIDAALHYHIDWIKVNYGNNDIKTKTFWNHLGLDQMSHQICYLLLALFMFS